MEKLIYNGKKRDETASLAVQEMFIGSNSSDTLRLVYDNEDGDWDDAKSGDIIKWSNDGVDMGKLYVRSVSRNGDQCELFASTMPPSMKSARQKVWKGSRLSAIGNEIAKKNGLEFKIKGFSEDPFYVYVEQDAETDIGLLYRLATREGAGIAFYNDKLIIYSEHKLEQKTARTTIDDGSIEVVSSGDKAAGFVEIVGDGVYGNYRIGKGLSIRKKITKDLGSDAEATRCAKSFARNYNKDLETYVLKIQLRSDICAGAMIQYNSEVYFAHHVRHEYHLDRSVIFMRKPLEGY